MAMTKSKKKKLSRKRYKIEMQKEFIDLIEKILQNDYAILTTVALATIPLELAGVDKKLPKQYIPFLMWDLRPLALIRMGAVGAMVMKGAFPLVYSAFMGRGIPGIPGV